MREHRDSYGVCVVRSALTDPRMQVFAYWAEAGRCESAAGPVLDVREVVAARRSTD
jgi:hypothetical protein